MWTYLDDDVVVVGNGVVALLLRHLSGCDGMDLRLRDCDEKVCRLLAF